MTRGEAIDVLDNLLGMVEDNHGTDYDEAIKMAIDALKQPERKKGHWIGIDDYPHEAWECDQCGCVYEEMPSWTPNYCPDCGAKMEMGDDENGEDHSGD